MVSPTPVKEIGRDSPLPICCLLALACCSRLAIFRMAVGYNFVGRFILDARVCVKWPKKQERRTTIPDSWIFSHHCLFFLFIFTRKLEMCLYHLVLQDVTPKGWLFFFLLHSSWLDICQHLLSRGGCKLHFLWLWIQCESGRQQPLSAH